MHLNYSTVPSGDEWVASEIHRLRMQMLVHSCLYYQLDQNVISDRQFDERAKRLAVLQNDFPDISEIVPNYEFFKDWDGSTGFNLPTDDTQLIAKAMYVKSISK